MKTLIAAWNICVALAMAQPALAQQQLANTGAGLGRADVEAWVDGYMSGALDRAGIAGAVVSVVDGGNVVLSKGYGYADVERKRPMDPTQTLVRVGSTSKLFTWTAVMQLVEQGRLDLNEDVNAYLDFEIPAGPGNPVTMNHLMAHRGGFEEGLREVLITDPDRFITTEHYLKNHPRPRLYAAGEVPAYSNYGTAIAGYIVERISGVPFDDYIDNHILAPLDMQRSTFRQPLPDRFQADMSGGYMNLRDAPRSFEFVTTAPAGSLSSTAHDMANFMIAHLQLGQFGQTRILRQETAQAMQTTAFPQPPGFATMSHGFIETTVNDRIVVGHGGDTVLFHTDLNLIPDAGVGIFVSFNSRGSQDAVYGIRQEFFAEFMDRYFPAPATERKAPAIAGAADDARAIAGHYQSSRRIETAFPRLLYILQQAELVAHANGTISFASDSDNKFRQIEPGVWREEGGDHALYIASVNGINTIVDSNNPTAVLQAVPAILSATFNLVVLGGSLLLIVLFLISWPIGWRYRRVYNQPLALSGHSLLAYWLTRCAALANLVYLYGWYLAMQPILENRFDAYGPSLDGFLRTLQFGAIVPIAGAGVGIWNAWITFRSDARITARVCSGLIAAALLGVAWIAWIGNLIGFNLEY